MGWRGLEWIRRGEGWGLLKGPPQDVFKNKYFVCTCLVMAAVVGLSLARPAAQSSNSTSATEVFCTVGHFTQFSVFDPSA